MKTQVYIFIYEIILKMFEFIKISNGFLHYVKIRVHHLQVSLKTI